MVAKLPFLIERARREGTPLIDGRLSPNGRQYDPSGANCRATFVGQGKNPPSLTGDFSHWAGVGEGTPPSALALHPVEPGVWARTLTFPRDAYVEYVFTKDGKRINDPLNPLKGPNGIGGINNFFYAPRARPTPFAVAHPNVPRGKVTSHVLQAGHTVYGSRRKLHLYAPPTNKPVPLLLALDGGDYMRRARLPVILDNLIGQAKIPPIAAVMVETTNADHGGVRMIEYACNELTLIFLLHQVLPFVRTQLRLVRRPHAHAILGASISGLMAMYTALRAPGLFGSVLSQAGAFDLWGHPTTIGEMAGRATVKPRVWLDVGQMDWLLETNQRMYAMLRRQDYDVKLTGYSAYHNWAAWRNELPQALMWAFAKGQG